MRIWITRAEPGASRTAERLLALGHEPVVAPLLEARPLPGAVNLDGVGALAFTSANGLRAFAGRSPERGLPVFAVGAATAAAARGLGFTAVASADGDVQALAELIARSAGRIAGTVLAPGPAEPAGNLAGDLAARGVAARAQALYETAPLDPPAGFEAPGAALVHSPKAARRLAEVAARPEALAVYCLSEAAAAPLKALPLRALAWAGSPDEESLFKLLPAEA